MGPSGVYGLTGGPAAPSLRWPLAAVDRRMLVVESGRVLEVVRHDLQPDREPGRVEAAGDGDGREAGVADRHRELAHARVAFRVHGLERRDERMRRRDERVHFRERLLSNLGDLAGPSVD